MTLAALDVARDRGLSVPQDLSLIAFGDTPTVRFAQPPLNAVDLPLAAAVSCAVERLIVPGTSSYDNAVIEVAARLIERSSTASASPRVA